MGVCTMHTPVLLDYAATVIGVNLKPIEKTIANGKAILQIQSDQTVAAIQKAISADK